MTNAPTVPVEQVEQARSNLRAARDLYQHAGDDEKPEATRLLIEAKKAYNRLVPEPSPRDAPQGRARGLLDPAQEAAEVRVERAERVNAQLGEYLEPEMQRLLAQQTLRGEALAWTRQLLSWLREADSYCAQGQPVLARRFIGESVKELAIQERALVEAPAKPGGRKPKRKKGGDA